MDKGAPKAIHLKDYQPPPHLIDTVDLHFDLREDVTTVTARLAMRRNPARSDGPHPLDLDGQHLELVSVALDGRPLAPTDYVLTPDRLSLPQVPETFTLDVVTRIKPQDNTALEGLYKSSGNFCTQCEAEGFRRITYFLDRPDVMARYTTTIEADQSRYPVLLSNGNPVAQGIADSGRHWVRWEDPFPKPCYLFALVAGNLVSVNDTFTTASGRKVTLRIHVEPGNEDQCDHAMRSLKTSMAWDEQVFGLEYDLDIFMIVAVSDFNMGAMENKGLNIFNTKYILARPDTATDDDFRGIESVVAHEYFHNWTGNRVTCRDWFQLSLKEGLTVFRDQEFSADMHSRAVHRISGAQAVRLGQFPEDAGPMAHPVRPDSYIEINNFYTPTVYSKGAEVIRMIHTLLGPKGFRKGMDLYFQRHDGQAVTCDDFVAAMADASGVDLDQFKRWYSQAGTPVLEADGSYDAASRTYRLRLRQSCPPTPGQPVKQPFHIPVRMGLVGPHGTDMPLRLAGEPAAAETTRVLHVKQPEEVFEFIDVAHAPVPSLLRGFSAPVRLLTNVPDGDLAFLMAHDSDLFNRWEAGQILATRLMLKLVEDRRQERTLELPPSFVMAMARTLAEAGRDREFAANALALPDENSLGLQMDIIDVDGIHEVREFVRRALAEALREKLLETYRANLSHAPFSVETEAMARRSLKNRCLGYLMALDDPESHGLCRAQFRGSQSMTDAVTALALLASSTSPDRQPALQEFYEKWRDHPLVVNKWLLIQAISSHPDTLNQVKALTGHPAFDIRNPNKVYALIRAFGDNPVRFHDKSGDGYRFLADQVLRIDPMNPQVASRVVKVFARWRKYDAGRQALMREQLQRIVGQTGLSPDVFEVASKSLAA